MRGHRGREREKPPEPQTASPEQIPECLAYHICKGKESEADCDVCLKLSEGGWREHARSVLSRAP